MQYFLKFNFKIRSPSSLDNLNCKRKIDNLRDICTKREKTFVNMRAKHTIYKKTLLHTRPNVSMKFTLFKIWPTLFYKMSWLVVLQLFYFLARKY